MSIHYSWRLIKGDTKKERAYIVVKEWVDDETNDVVDTEEEAAYQSAQLARAKVSQLTGEPNPNENEGYRALQQEDDA